MTLTASDLRASDFFIGLLVAVVMLIGAGVLVTTIGPHGEAVAAVTEDREVVAVRPVEGRMGERKAAPQKKATPRVQPLEPARPPEPRVRPQPRRVPATAPAPRQHPESESESESESE